MLCPLGTLILWTQPAHVLHAYVSMDRPGAQVEDYFTRLVQRVAPKSDAQARAEVVVTRRFLENFSGDQVCAHEDLNPC